MATLVITEYREIGMDANGNYIPAGNVPALAYQNIDFSSGNETSAFFNKGTTFLEVSSDTACRVKVNAASSAADGTRLPANAIVYYILDKGIQGDGASYLDVTSE